MTKLDLKQIAAKSESEKCCLSKLIYTNPPILFFGNH